MSAPETEVGKSGEKSVETRLEKAKKLIEPGVYILSLAVMGVTSYYGALEKSRIETRTQIEELHKKTDERLKADETTITALEREAGRIRLYLESNQAIGLTQFTLKCQRLQGSYDSNQKTCTYMIQGQDITERLPYLLPQDPFTVGQKP